MQAFTKQRYDSMRAKNIGFNINSYRDMENRYENFEDCKFKENTK